VTHFFDAGPGAPFIASRRIEHDGGRRVVAAGATAGTQTRLRIDPDCAPRTWAEWEWPDWVPAGVREQVESFWLEKWGRGPQAWIRNAIEQGAPDFGAVVTLGDGFGPNPPLVTGHFVHAWNNIGRLVLGDGSFRYTSFSSQTRRSA
jgi:hypothetical protein